MTDKTKEFIKKAKIAHDNKYDYSKTKFVNARTKVIINCPLHGDFLQIPDKHLRNHKKTGKPQGCRECGKESSKTKQTHTKDDFIKKAIIKYGNKYTYEKVIYINDKTKVFITCPRHGEFQMTPNLFLNPKTKGCPIDSKHAKMTLNRFLFKARKIHGGAYDYSKIEFEKTEDVVSIICWKHGEFLQSIKSHIYNFKGCMECGKLCSFSNLWTTTRFIQEAKLIYGSKYDYCISIFLDYDKFINIICYKHGIFKIKAKDHLSGKECPECEIIDI